MFHGVELVMFHFGVELHNDPINTCYTPFDAEKCTEFDDTKLKCTKLHQHQQHGPPTPPWCNLVHSNWCH